MRVKQLGLAIVGALALAGCSKDDGPFFAPTVPLAYVRFINAVPDTVTQDFRFIDFLEYSPYAIQLGFRSFTPYQGAAPGSRHLRVFTDPGGSPTLDQVTRILVDEQVTLEADKYYSLVVTGFARTGSTPALRLQVYEDNFTDPGTQVAVRVVNLAAGLNPINVALTPTHNEAIPAPTFSNVAYLDASNYLSRASGETFFRVQETTAATEIVAAGGSGNACANLVPLTPGNCTGVGRRVPTGAAGDPVNQLTTIGGSGQSGSVVTGWVFPRSVAGSTAPNVTAPSIIFTVDRHPR
jgi:hypothetical protein